MSLRSEIVRILNEYFAGSKKISQLPIADTITGPELLEIVQDGISKQTTVDDLPSGGGGGSPTKVIQAAASDETTAITSGANKLTFRLPQSMSLFEVRASLTTAQTSGSLITIDIHENGTTILSTKITIDNGEKTSTTALAQPVISDSSLADDAEITIDVDQIGDGTAKGLKITLLGT